MHPSTIVYKKNHINIQHSAKQQQKTHENEENLKASAVKLIPILSIDNRYKTMEFR